MRHSGRFLFLFLCCDLCIVSKSVENNSRDPLKSSGECCFHLLSHILAGHEAAFAAFLCCLCKIGVLGTEDQLAVVFQVFTR